MTVALPLVTTNDVSFADFAQTASEVGLPDPINELISAATIVGASH